jgi:epoxide hydrolase-like predicted phosphatase
VADAPRRTGVLLDFGGVLTTDLFASFAAFCGKEGLDPERVRHIFRDDEDARRLLIDLETGKIDEVEFEPAFARMLEVADGGGLIGRLMAGAKPDHRMMNAVRAARDQGIRTGLISNSWGVARYDRKLLADLFDGVVISGEVGIRKPAREIYTLGAEAIGTPPEECVFVDDLDFNLKPARELGMATVHHTGVEDTVPELERLLGVRLR